MLRFVIGAKSRNLIPSDAVRLWSGFITPRNTLGLTVGGVSFKAGLDKRVDHCNLQHAVR